MTYEDIGYDSLLSQPQLNQISSQQIDATQFDNFVDYVSGSKIQGGILQTNDGKARLNLEEGYFAVNNGVIDLARLGKLSDGKVGLLVQDSKGNKLMQISEGLNFIQSGDQIISFDFDNKRILIKDESGNPAAIFGIQ